MSINPYLSKASFAAGAILAVMVIIGLASGTSQQTFEWLMQPQDYATRLLAEAAPLKLIIGLDNLFIALYSSLVLMLAQAYWNPQRQILLIAFIAAGVTGGVLDYLENLHIFTMLTAAQQGLLPELSELELRMVHSMLKWHLGYAAFFLLGFIIQPKNWVQRLFQLSLWFVQLPVGVFYYIYADTAWGDALFMARYLNLLAGFILIGWFFQQRPASSEGLRDQLSAT